MEKSRIEEIIREVTDQFGEPIEPIFDPDWFAFESARRVLAENVCEPQCVASLIDHAILKPDATKYDIRKACEEALEHRFASVCVNPCWVEVTAELLKDSNSMVCATVGFPLGANVTDTKVEEAARAAEQGADELDMVANIGAIKSGNWEVVHSEIAVIAKTVDTKPLKVIIETSLLTDEEIVRASAIAANAGAAYTKTSTGFVPGGATTKAVRLMTQTVGEKLGVKASGGIGDFEKALAMLKAGATRIGASRSLSIIGA